MSRRVWMLAVLAIVGSWALLSLRRAPSAATLNEVPQEREPLPARELPPAASAEVEREPEPETPPQAQSAAPEPSPPKTPPAAQPEPTPTRPKPTLAPPEPTPAAEAQPKRNPLAPEHSGPIVELSQRFTREPRPSGAGETEGAIRAQFSLPAAPRGVLENVICKTTVCRLELRWTEETANAYMDGVMRAYYAINLPSMASQPNDTPEADGGLRVMIYFGKPSDSGP